MAGPPVCHRCCLTELAPERARRHGPKWLACSANGGGPQLVDGTGLVESQDLHEPTHREVLADHKCELDDLTGRQQSLESGHQLVADGGGVTAELLGEVERRLLRRGEGIALPPARHLAEQILADTRVLPAVAEADRALVDLCDA